jgi:alkylhydroperoxidase/carboxymuconolactone decarboxylase family protein YurZ
MQDPHKKSQTPVTDHLRASGGWNPNWDSFAELDPVWTEKFVDMGVAPLIRGALDPRTWELIAIAVDASCTHMYAPGVRRHIRKALELGVSKEEILAVLQTVSVLGIHSMSLGAPILVEELAARNAQEGNSNIQPTED